MTDTDLPTPAPRTLGSAALDTALTVSELGLGCMGISEFYGAPDEEAGTETILRALDLGITFFDTADMYGPFTNEKLLGRVLGPRRDEVVLATKFGNVRGENGERLGISGTPEYVLRLVDQVRTIAAAKGCTPGQLALAWVLAQGEAIVPIPGTRRVRHLEENLGATTVDLTAEDLAALDAAVPRDAVVGDRYGDMSSVNR